MDLTNFTEKYAQIGERNSNNSDYVWNGVEWVCEPQKVWDFSLKDDWLLLLVVGALVIGGLKILLNLI